MLSSTLLERRRSSPPTCKLPPPPLLCSPPAMAVVPRRRNRVTEITYASSSRFGHPHASPRPLAPASRLGRAPPWACATVLCPVLRNLVPWVPHQRPCHLPSQPPPPPLSSVASTSSPSMTERAPPLHGSSSVLAAVPRRRARVIEIAFASSSRCAHPRGRCCRRAGELHEPAEASVPVLVFLCACFSRCRVTPRWQPRHLLCHRHLSLLCAFQVGPSTLSLSLVSLCSDRVSWIQIRTVLEHLCQ